jgi:hypothetical protein
VQCFGPKLLLNRIVGFKNKKAKEIGAFSYSGIKGFRIPSNVERIGVSTVPLQLTEECEYESLSEVRFDGSSSVGFQSWFT